MHLFAIHILRELLAGIADCKKLLFNLCIILLSVSHGSGNILYGSFLEDAAFKPTLAGIGLGSSLAWSHYSTAVLEHLSELL